MRGSGYRIAASQKNSRDLCLRFSRALPVESRGPAKPQETEVTDEVVKQPPYIDDPTVREAYAETVQVLTLATGAVRIELCVNRWSHANPVHITHVSPVARVAMTMGLAMALRDQLTERIAALQDQASLAQAPAASPAKN